MIQVAGGSAFRGLRGRPDIGRPSLEGAPMGPAAAGPRAATRPGS
jgi:hypothetical protein